MNKLTLLIAMRIDPATADAADRLIGQRSKPLWSTSGMQLIRLRNRSDVLREAIRRGLEDLELCATGDALPD